MTTLAVDHETAGVLDAMLKECTGASILDSGGTPKFDERGNYLGSQHGYGRHWERNRCLDFASEPPSTLSFDWNEISVTHHVYHWLLERVAYDAAMQNLFERCRRDNDPDDDIPWLPLVEQFPLWLREQGHEVAGLYGSGEPFTHNTYNAESLLSQMLQFTYFELSEPGARWGQAHVLLQVHNGCDVRGGYTAPKAFRVDDDAACILCSADARIYCEPISADAPGQLGLNGERVPPPEPHHWQTDDGYHWYDESSAGRSAGTQLEQYERRTIASAGDWRQGHLCVDQDGNGYCPKCGGQLQASF